MSDVVIQLHEQGGIEGIDTQASMNLAVADIA